MEQVNLTLGEWFNLGNQTLSEPSFYGFAMERRLILRNGRPIGHLTAPDRRPDSKCFLWLPAYTKATVSMDLRQQ
jgi:hypothetical protein